VRRFTGPGFSDYKKLINTRGASSGWAGETDARSETDTPTLQEVSLTSGELYAEPRTTRWALEDVMFNVGGWLADEVSEEFSFQEGSAFINGNGTNKPTGFLSGTPEATGDGDSPARPFGTLEFIEASGDNVTLTSWDDSLYAMMDSLKSGYLSNAVWVMNKRTKTDLLKKQNLNGEFIWQPSIVGGAPDRLFGYPVVIADEMPDIGADAFPVAFGDFRRGYQIIETPTIVLPDPYTTKGYVKYYTARRVGGKVTNSEAIKLIKTTA